MNDVREAVETLSNERRAAEALIDNLNKIEGVDDETKEIALESETDLFEAIHGALGFLTETEIKKEGLKAVIAKLEARLARYEDREGYIRTAIEQAMYIGMRDSLEYPEGTLTLTRRQAAVVITDEHLIPAEFWKKQDPTLDKRALAKALKDQKTIPGASLGNGGISLTVRRA